MRKQVGKLQKRKNPNIEKLLVGILQSSTSEPRGPRVMCQDKIHGFDGRSINFALRFLFNKKGLLNVEHWGW